MLLDESGMILGAGEQVVKQGKCKGKVPKGMQMKLKLGFARASHQQRVEWQDIDGELVLTNKRAIALNKEGTIRKQIMTYEFSIVGAVAKKKDKLELLIDVGKSQAERTELKVDSAQDWTDAIKKIVSQQQ